MVRPVALGQRVLGQLNVDRRRPEHRKRGHRRTGRDPGLRHRHRRPSSWPRATPGNIWHRIRRGDRPIARFARHFWLQRQEHQDQTDGKATDDRRGMDLQGLAAISPIQPTWRRRLISAAPILQLPGWYPLSLTSRIWVMPATLPYARRSSSALDPPRALVCTTTTASPDSMPSSPFPWRTAAMSASPMATGSSSSSSITIG